MISRRRNEKTLNDSPKFCIHPLEYSKTIQRKNPFSKIIEVPYQNGFKLAADLEQMQSTGTIDSKFHELPSAHVNWIRSFTPYSVKQKFCEMKNQITVYWGVLVLYESPEMLMSLNKEYFYSSYCHYSWMSQLVKQLNFCIRSREQSLRRYSRKWIESV